MQGRSRWGARVLTLVCPRCGNTFQSVLQTDPRTLEAMRVETMLERCSYCDHAFRVKKAAYEFQSDEGPFGDPFKPIQ
jgi:uncharacterized C2H2 Zn-finger protein